MDSIGGIAQWTWVGYDENGQSEYEMVNVKEWMTRQARRGKVYTWQELKDKEIREIVGPLKECILHRREK